MQVEEPYVGCMFGVVWRVEDDFDLDDDTVVDEVRRIAAEQGAILGNVRVIRKVGDPNDSYNRFPTVGVKGRVVEVRRAG